MKTKLDVINQLEAKIKAVEARCSSLSSDPKVAAQYEIAISNLYRALATLYIGYL